MPLVESFSSIDDNTSSRTEGLSRLGSLWCWRFGFLTVSIREISQMTLDNSVLAQHHNTSLDMITSPGDLLKLSHIRPIHSSFAVLLKEPLVQCMSHHLLPLNLDVSTFSHDTRM